MSLFNKMVNKTLSNLADQALDQVLKNVKDSGVINSTIDNISNSLTNGTKFSRIQHCSFCGREYDNTEEMCPGCGAPNENRKVDYQKLNNQNNQNHLLNIGDVISDGNLTIYIVDIKGDNYITTLSKNGSIKTPQKIATVDGALSEGTFHKV